MSNDQMRRFMLVSASIALILLNAAVLCSSQDSGDQLNLPKVCNETDAPRIIQEEGTCWKCECFDDKHWGCFQGSGNCSNTVTPSTEFAECQNTDCDGTSVCFPYGTGDLWVDSSNELCWCDDGESKCNIDSALSSNVTKDFSNFLDYRNSGKLCVKEEKLVLNFGDAILTNCSICTCINGSFWCSEREDCENGLVELACPKVVSGDCQGQIFELCTDDSHCLGDDTKCCLSECVRHCDQAVPAGSVLKPGTCPDLQVTSPLGLVAACFTDYDCEGHLKCCNHNSIYICLEPYDPDDCEEGEDMVPCTFSNPCESTRCPKHPQAMCRISHCGTCHAQYFVDNVRVNCYEDDECDIYTPLVPCYLEGSCPFQPCPETPNAECRLNYCGNCFYEFFNTSGNKVACFPGDPCPEGTAEFHCDYTCDAPNYFCPGAAGANVTCVPNKCGGCGFPKYYFDNGTEVQCFNLKDNCPEGNVLPRECTDYCNLDSFSCTNPDVVSCQINYCEGACSGEYFNANGERVSCFGGQVCPPGQQETPYCPSDCSNEACFAYPNAVCEVNSCGFSCDKIFRDPDSNNTVNCSEGYSCPEESPVNPFCNDVFTDFLFPGCLGQVCPKHPDAKCFKSPCGFCHPEFYIGQERVNCYGDIPCPQGTNENSFCENLCETTAYCPADLSAICLMNQCNGKCEAIFQDLEGNIIEDCFEGVQCPSGEVDALCPYNLCQSETCEAHPEAECRLNHCGTCRAQFFFPNGTEITKCSVLNCPSHMPSQSCGDVCSGLVCMNHPNATCSVNNCGRCKAEFFSPDGIQLSDEDCGVSEREGFCPAETLLSIENDCQTDGDCVAPEKCCSLFPGIDIIKYCVEPLDENPHGCEYEGTRYDPHEIRLGECELCTCLLGQWSCYNTKCNLSCTLDDVESCNVNDCMPTEQLCPANIDARCTINPCGGCTIEHLLENDTVVDCFDPDLLQCPEEEAPVTCEFNPCPLNCPSYPEAICRINACGTCKAEHVFDDRIVDCNEQPRCSYMGYEFINDQTFRISDEECMHCICFPFNQSVCFPLGTECPDPLPCEENGVEYPPLFIKRDNCTECVCSATMSGQFGCLEIPNCYDFEKEGVCPPKQGSPKECVEEVIHKCHHDGDCTGSEKCCHEYCGSICEKPVPEGPTCFSCISYFNDDVPNIGDTCSDVAVPSVDVVKCNTRMVCASIRADVTFNVNHNPEVNKSITVVQRGCFFPENVPQNASGCIKGSDTALPTVYEETEELINRYEGKASIEEFSVSACFCEEHTCNSVILPLPPSTTQATVSETTEQAISTAMSTEETTPMTTAILKTSLQSTTLHATSTQVPETETTLEPKYTTITPGVTSSKGTSPRTPSSISNSTGTTTESTTQQITTGTTSTMTSSPSPSTQSQGNFCILRGEPSRKSSFQSNPCSNCVCDDGFFLCRFNTSCLEDVSIEEVAYTLSGNFSDVAGMEEQFKRTLIQNLARELMIDETVFLNVELSAGSVKVIQNITDSKSVDLSVKEISEQIQRKVDMGMFTFTFNGKSYTSLNGTFELGQSYKFSSENIPTSLSNKAGLIAIIVIGVLVIILVTIIVTVKFKIWHKKKMEAEAAEAVLLRVSRSPSLNSDKFGPVEFENPVYHN